MKNILIAFACLFMGFFLLGCLQSEPQTNLGTGNLITVANVTEENDLTTGAGNLTLTDNATISLSKADFKNLSSENKGNFFHRVKDKEGKEILNDTVKNKIDKASDTFLDCNAHPLICERQIEISPSKKLLLDSDFIKGLSNEPSVWFDPLFFRDTRQVQKTRPVFSPQTSERCTSSSSVSNQTGLNATTVSCQNVTSQIQTGTETYFEAETFENTNLTQIDRKTLAILRAHRPHPWLRVNLGYSILGQERWNSTWWNASYSHKMEVNITNGTCNTPGWCQFEIPIDINETITNGSNIAVLDGTETTTFGYWREDGWNYSAASGILWVNATNTTTTLYVYLNGTGAADLSNIKSISDCSDDFNAASINTTLWSNSASHSQSGGSISLVPTTIAARMRSTCDNAQDRQHKFKLTINGGESYMDFETGGVWGLNILYRTQTPSTYVAMNGGDTDRGNILNASTPYIIRYLNPATGNSNLSAYYPPPSNSFLVGIAGTPSTKSTGWAPLHFVTSTSSVDFYVLSSHFSTTPTFSIGSAVAQSITETVAVQQISPASNTNFLSNTTSVNFSWSCSGTQNTTSWLSNLTINGSVNQSNVAVSNNTTYSTLVSFSAGSGANSWLVNCVNGSVSATGSTLAFTISPYMAHDLFIQIAATGYNNTVVNYTFTPIIHSTGVASQTMNYTLRFLNGTSINSSNSQALASGALATPMNSSVSLLRPTSDSNYTLVFQAINSTLSMQNTTVFMILPIDPPSALALKGGADVFSVIGDALSWVWGQLTAGVMTISGSPTDWTWRTWAPASGRQIMNGTATDWKWINE